MSALQRDNTACEAVGVYSKLLETRCGWQVATQAGQPNEHAHTQLSLLVQ